MYFKKFEFGQIFICYNPNHLIVGWNKTLYKCLKFFKSEMVELRNKLLIILQFKQGMNSSANFLKDFFHVYAVFFRPPPPLFFNITFISEMK